MQLAEDTCWAAVERRDGRFDGRFFTAVRTTGVYCRPVCPARTPLRRNVEFFPCAAAAEERGYRPCRRCRPDAAPGTPAWLGTEATVSRALRLIEQGALDSGDVPALAERLGVGVRQLRRLFRRHVGTTPTAVAQTRRAHFARAMLEGTDLPVTTIAHASGFGSVRRFNEAVRDRFGRAPTELRRRGARRDGGVELRLAYRPPLAWDALLAFLAPRAIPGIERVEGGRYSRTVGGACPGRIELRHAPPAVLLRADAALSGQLLDVVSRVRRLLDLDAAPLTVAERLGGAPRLSPGVAALPGLRVPGAFDAFELVVRAVLGQQVSVAAATTLAGRLVDRYGQPLAGDAPDRLFPSPATLAGADVEAIGLPAARAFAIRSVARAFVDGLRLDGAPGDRETLAAIRGVGPWTVEYVAMRALADADAFPESDLGLRRALGDGAPASPREARARAERFRPFRAYAAMHLWTEETTCTKP